MSRLVTVVDKKFVIAELIILFYNSKKRQSQALVSSFPYNLVLKLCTVDELVTKNSFALFIHPADLLHGKKPFP